MKRVGLTWKVDPEFWEKYQDVHLNPWPGLIEEFQKAGIHNFNAFFFGTQVFGYLEVDGEDVFEALGQMAKSEIKQKWDAEITAWVLPEVEEGSRVQFMELERIFYVP